MSWKKITKNIFILVFFIFISSIQAGQEFLPGEEYKKDVVRLNEELRKLNQGVTLPKGAVFFMITGSCPAGTTDVTATYSDKSVRVNATQGTTGGSDTVTLLTANMPAHTHTVTANQRYGQSPETTSTPYWTNVDTAGASATATSSSTGSGTAVTVTNPYVTCKMCQVN